MSTPQLNSNGNNVGSLDKILQVVLSLPLLIHRSFVKYNLYPRNRTKTVLPSPPL